MERLADKAHTTAHIDKTTISSIRELARPYWAWRGTHEVWELAGVLTSVGGVGMATGDPPERYPVEDDH